jgi:carboxypeptidase family protein
MRSHRLVALALVVGAATAAAQTVRQDDALPNRLVSSLSGTLYGSGPNGLAGMRIVLLSPIGTPMYEAKTDADGRFLFGEIPPGTYTAAIQRTGYTVELGQVHLAGGQRTDRVFQKGVVAAGRVVNESGEPMPAIPVCLLRAARFGTPGSNSVRYRRAASALTNARGQFVIGREARLDRGTYVAAVMPAGCDAFTDPALANPEFARYAPTYFPGTTLSGEASPLTLIEEEDADLPFALRPTPVTQLLGKISNYVNTTIIPDYIHLEPLADEPGSLLRTAKIEPDGSFTFAGLIPGKYRLLLAPRKGPDPLTWADEIVTVNGEATRRVPVFTHAASAIGGTLDFDGQPSALYLTPVFLIVNATPVAEEAQVTRMMPGNFASVAVDGKFGITGLMPGKYRLTVTGAEPLGWRAASAIVPSPQGRLSSLDALDVPIALDASGGRFGIVIRMTHKTTAIAGQIEDEAGRPAAGVQAVIFAPDPRYWIEGSRRLKRVTADARGAFTVEVPDGDYLAAAVRQVPRLPDTEWLESIRGGAVPLHLDDGDTRELRLRLMGATVLPRVLSNMLTIAGKRPGRP